MPSSDSASDWPKAASVKHASACEVMLCFAYGFIDRARYDGLNYRGSLIFYRDSEVEHEAFNPVARRAEVTGGSHFCELGSCPNT